MSMSYFFDKSSLSDELQARQKSKGTFDSPCLSVCDYSEGDLICQTCLMKKSEKAEWKVAEPREKEALAWNIKKRRDKARL